MTKRSLLFAGLFLLIALALVFIARRADKPPTFRLSDGSVLRFDGADSGTTLYYPVSQRTRIQLWNLIPNGVRRHLGSQHFFGLLSLQREHLFAGFERTFGIDGSPSIVGLTPRGPSQELVLSGGVKPAKLFVTAVDENGFEASMNQPWFMFTQTSAFEMISTSHWPRRSRRIGLRLHEMQETNLLFVAEIWFANPTRSKLPPPLEPEDLPVTKTNQSIAVTLKSLDLGHLPAPLAQNDDRKWSYCRLEVKENGILTTNWQVTYCVLSDGTGNSLEYPVESVSIAGEEYVVFRAQMPADSGIDVPRTLWTSGETAWKIEVAFNERFNPKRDSTTRGFGTGKSRHAWIHSTPVYDERWLTFQVRPPARQKSD